MRKNVVVVAPHPDDETLGCGGTLFRHKDAGDAVHWIIATSAEQFESFSKRQKKQRIALINKVARIYAFKSVVELGLPTTKLDQIPMANLVEPFRNAFAAIKPHTVYLPFHGDVHSDHARVFEASVSALKWFRCPGVSRVLSYETLSETEQQLFDHGNAGFNPNVFIDISLSLQRKLAVLAEFRSELRPFPFPRSKKAVRALAEFRGAAAGYSAAEAFVLLRERI